VVLEWALHAYTLSPHLVPTPCLLHLGSTPCLLHLVSTLCLYALSRSEEEAAELSRTRLIVLVLEPTGTAGTAGTADGYRQVSPGGDRNDDHPRMLPQCGADIPVCARPRGQAGMPAPHYHAPSLRLAGTASPHLCWRSRGNSPATRHQPDHRGWFSTTSAFSATCTGGTHAAPAAPAAAHCLLQLLPRINTTPATGTAPVAVRWARGRCGEPFRPVVAPPPRAVRPPALCASAAPPCSAPDGTETRSP
jgi:hypothetical protein